jgi:hypothetical protein
VTKYLLLATVADRADMLAACLRSVEKFLPGWRLVIVTQECDAAMRANLDTTANAETIHLPARIGPHRAKSEGLKLIDQRHADGGYVVCSIDDDMEFISATDLDPCIQRAMERGVGFVSAGWVPHESRVAKRHTPSVFVNQPIVYTGGGMIFGSEVTRIVLRLDPADYFSDNTEWSLAVYLAGYENFRFRGSLTIHRVCSRGGRRAWIATSLKRIPDAKYLVLKPGAKGGLNDWHIGDSSGLTEEAVRHHHFARACRFGSQARG